MKNMTNKKFIANGVIKNKMKDSNYYCILLNEQSSMSKNKYLLRKYIIGDCTPGKSGKLYYIWSDRISLYQFEVD